jgi:hypothetical protein
MEVLKNLLLIAFFIGLIILVPILVILSVNVLFLTAIPLTMETWAATVMLGIFIRGWKTVKENN